MDSMTRKIFLSPLTFAQKLDSVKKLICSKMDYLLLNGDDSKNRLRRLEQNIRLSSSVVNDIEFYLISRKDFPMNSRLISIIQQLV